MQTFKVLISLALASVKNLHMQTTPLKRLQLESQSSFPVCIYKETLGQEIQLMTASFAAALPEPAPQIPGVPCQSGVGGNCLIGAPGGPLCCTAGLACVANAAAGMLVGMQLGVSGAIPLSLLHINSGCVEALCSTYSAWPSPVTGGSKGGCHLWMSEDAIV